MACFIDLENVVKNIKFEERLSTIQNYCESVSLVFQMKFSIIKGYGDFNHLMGVSQNDLALIDIVPRHVDQNDVHMQMCVDITKSVYTRDDIDTYVIVAGNLGYGPIEQHLRDNGKKIYVHRISNGTDIKTEIDENRMWKAFVACFDNDTEWMRCSLVGTKFRQRTGQHFKDYRPQWIENGLIQTRGELGNIQVTIVRK